MLRKRWRSLLIVFLSVVLAALLSGCGKKTEKPEKIKDVEYTVLEESQVPEELLAKMKEKRQEPFNMTYEAEGYVYIAKGYGTQKTSGYSVRVSELYEAKEGIVCYCELLGPGRQEPVMQTETYPYIVIKIPSMGLDIIF